MGLRREGCCLALFLAQPPKRGGILAYACPGMVTYEGKYRALPYGGAVIPGRCLRAGRSRNWRDRIALRRLASSLPRAARVDVPFGTVARVAIGPS